MLTDIQVMEYKDVMQPRGESYYVSTSSVTHTSVFPTVDFSNPIITLVIGMLAAFAISYLIYYVKKHHYTYDQIWKTFCGLLGLSGLGFIVFGIIDLAFVGREGIIYPIIGLLFIYAGGSFLKDMEEDSEKLQEYEK